MVTLLKNDFLKEKLDRLCVHRYCLLRWDGKDWKGGDLRSRVAGRCREVFPEAKSDDEAIGKACDKSSFFCGLFKLLA